MPRKETKKVEAELDPRYASKEDVNKIMDLLESLSSKDNKPKTIDQRVEDKLDKASELPDVNPVPQKYRILVDEILGSDFGINIVYPDSGSTLFKVIVPRDKSNASDAHLEFYQHDIRTLSVGSKGIEGIKKWLEKVSHNLKQPKK